MRLIKLRNVDPEKFLHGDDLPDVDLLSENTSLVVNSVILGGSPYELVLFGPRLNQLKSPFSGGLSCLREIQAVLRQPNRHLGDQIKRHLFLHGWWHHALHI